MNNCCNDNRFELIKKYKDRLIESTNIADSHVEMATIDDTLFRFWQMGWLDILETYTEIHNGDLHKYIDADKFLVDNEEFADRDFIHPKYEETLRDLVYAAPAADIVPAIHGHWVIDADGNHLCDICGLSPVEEVLTDCCPHCGAKMYGRKD